MIVVHGTLVDIHLEGLRKLTDATLAGELPTPAHQFQHACQNLFVRWLIVCHVASALFRFRLIVIEIKTAVMIAIKIRIRIHNNNKQVHKRVTRSIDTVNSWSLLHAYDSSFNLFRFDSTITLSIRYRNASSQSLYNLTFILSD